MKGRHSVRATQARRMSWFALGLIVAVALFVGRGDGSPPTDAERADRISSTLRCPTCRSQSMADSDAIAARAGREEVLRQVKEGRSDAEIEAWFVDRYGGDIRLDPPRRGVAVLVWALPVVGAAAAVTALVLAFRRWRPVRRRSATDEDRALVEGALDL